MRVVNSLSDHIEAGMMCFALDYVGACEIDSTSDHSWKRLNWQMVHSLVFDSGWPHDWAMRSSEVPGSCFLLALLGFFLRISRVCPMQRSAT